MATPAKSLTLTAPEPTVTAAAPISALPLKDCYPRNIWVRIYKGAPQFSPDGENWSFSSLEWTCAPGDTAAEDKYALIITYHLVLGPGELEFPTLRPSNSLPTLFFSPVIGPIGTGGTPTQMGAVPWVAARTVFTFSVSDLDPEFPVTPG